MTEEMDLWLKDLAPPYTLAHCIRLEHLPAWLRSMDRLPYKLRRIPGADVPEDASAPMVCLQLRLRAANCRDASWCLPTPRPPDWARPDLGLGSNARFDVRLCVAARLAYCRDTSHLFLDLLSPASRDTIQFLQRR
jgi:hypothetical protein